MTEYTKIPAIFKRDTTGSKKLIEGAFCNETIEFLKDNVWVCTEKIDGTNIGIVWDGHKVSYQGRTERAQLPTHLFYVTDKDKAWYKERYGIRYSDAYEVYGLMRTGCCGCPISYKAIEDLEKIRPYEPNVVRAAYAIFGESYEYRRKYNEYKERRKEEDKNG